MKKKYINAALLFSIVSVNLTLAPAVLAEAAESVPESELIITETDAFTPEEIAEWEKETPKSVEPDPKNYERASFGAWSWRPGLVAVTDARFSGVINHGHAGITGAHPYYGKIIEANKETGVRAHSGEWKVEAGKNVWELTVTTTTVAEDKAAAERAAGQIGKPYNSNFYDVWRRDKYYCSQLVWASFRDTAGNKADISLNDWGAAIHPFELRDHPNTKLIYRRY
ncbi:YiiX/YebB-like N1pC/P60 family cysteine hydrolase [Streptococcus suis]